MAKTLGSTSHVSDTAQATTGTTNSQVASNLTMTEDGDVTFVSVYMAGYGGACSTQCSIWNTSSTQIAVSASFSATSRTFATGASDHYNKALTAKEHVADGTTIRVGWTRSSSGDGFQWDRNDGVGNTYLGDGLAGSMTSVTTETTRKPNVYITYDTVPLIYVRRASAWVQVTDVQVKRASAWATVGTECYVKRGGVWDQVT